MSESDHKHPGGRAWPVALRRELGLPNSPTDNDEDADMGAYPTLRRKTIQNSFTANELRQYIHRSYATISSLQRQLYRGEESYFDDSHAHGNLFSGWDSIWIEAGENNTNTGELSHKTSSVRKMPNDYRWFTSSCAVDPRGDTRMERILARGSLAETPQSTSPVKSGGTEASGRVLKRSTPLRVSSSPSKTVVDLKTEFKGLSSEPTAKKTKFDDTSVKIEANAADTKASSGQQKVVTARSLPLASNRMAALAEHALKKPDTVSSSNEAVTAAMDTSPTDGRDAVKATQKTGSLAELKTALATPTTDIMAASPVVKCESKLIESKQDTLSNDINASEKLVDTVCDMEVEKIVSSVADASTSLADTISSKLIESKQDTLSNDINASEKLVDTACDMEIEKIVSSEADASTSSANKILNDKESAETTVAGMKDATPADHVAKKEVCIAPVNQASGESKTAKPETSVVFNSIKTSITDDSNQNIKSSGASNHCNSKAVNNGETINSATRVHNPEKPREAPSSVMPVDPKESIVEQCLEAATNKTESESKQAGTSCNEMVVVKNGETINSATRVHNPEKPREAPSSVMPVDPKESTVEQYVAAATTNKTESECKQAGTSCNGVAKKDDGATDQSIEKMSKKSTTKDEKPIAESPLKSKRVSGTPTDSTQNVSPQKPTAAAASSDSDEDVTLSQIVKMKNKTKQKPPGPKSRVGTRTSSRRRKPPN